jgi:hypothetical protein
MIHSPTSLAFGGSSARAPEDLGRLDGVLPR